MTASLHMEKLQRTHAVESFTCGQPEFDRFLLRHALQAQQMNSSQTYVGVSDKTVVGFYTIVAGEVRHADAPERVVNGRRGQRYNDQALAFGAGGRADYPSVAAILQQPRETDH